MTDPNAKLRRQQWASAGLCTGCGERDDASAAAGFRWCAECRAVRRVKERDHSAMHRRRKERADAAGLCRACLREPRQTNPRKSRTRCAACAEKFRAYQRDMRERLAASGRCAECRGPHWGAGRRCEACAAENRARVNRARKRAATREAA